MFILRRASEIAGRGTRFSLNVQRRTTFITHKTMPSLQHSVDSPYEKATFGMGCFWACDALYGACPGVLRTSVGYSGGTMESPVYRNLGDHTEVIEIDYDPKTISYGDLLALFWENHEYGLTTKIKRQYMSLILYHTDEQKSIAEQSLKNEAVKRKTKLVTEIAKAGPFHPAEDYHQKYRLQRHPWLCDKLDISPDILHSSHIAAKINGYVTGLGQETTVDDDLNKFGFDDKMISYVKKEWKSNKGGTLYC